MHKIITAGGAATALALSLFHSISPAAADTGSATIGVEVENPGPPVDFVFTGVPAGSAGAGDSISESNLQAGAYTTAQTSGSPGYQLLSITCDDDNSTGYINTATTRFNIARSESVTCIYRYRASEIEEPTPVPSAGPAEPAAPEVPDPPEDSPQPQEPDTPPQASDCQAPDLVPREGVWMVSNLPGRMVCGPAINMPLTPSQEPGTLEIRDCGWTIIGAGMSDGTAPLTMRAVDRSSGRYTGTVGGQQDGIPMNIDFQWDVHSETHITGQLHSQVSQQGMTCTMSRPFELNFTGG